MELSASHPEPIVTIRALEPSTFRTGPHRKVSKLPANMDLWEITGPDMDRFQFRSHGVMPSGVISALPPRVGDRKFSIPLLRSSALPGAAPLQKC
jgi:hypothetical protein